MNINKEKILDVLFTAGKIVSFLSLVMTVVIKTRILLGLKNPSEKVESKDGESKDGESKEVENDSKS
jgi:hypothetical protein